MSAVNIKIIRILVSTSFSRVNTKGMMAYNGGGGHVGGSPMIYIFKGAEAKVKKT